MSAVKRQTGCRPRHRRRPRFIRCVWLSFPSVALDPPCGVARARFPTQRPLEGCTHCAPPIASATAQTFASRLRVGRPRRLRLSGAGKALNFEAHSLQYTLSCVWIRYQRQPHPSQTFSCTRTSMTRSPYCSRLPMEFYSVGSSPGCRESGPAVQISPVLLEEYRPRSLVFCHEVLCADPGISRPACFLGAPDERFQDGQG